MLMVLGAHPLSQLAFSELSPRQNIPGLNLPRLVILWRLHILCLNTFDAVLQAAASQHALEILLQKDAEVTRWFK